ncbi:MAG: hypothetical protein IT289_08285, partial [Oligoflexia bacterium]|nr:hypothetical protein [Oligoflexia bacterium]
MMNMFSIEKTLKLNASSQRVFAALTKDIAKWWSPDYLIGGEKAKKIIC